MKRITGWIFVACLGASLVACGSDTKKEPSSAEQDCPDGQVWNPIQAKCEDEKDPYDNNASDNNSTDSNNNQTDPGNNDGNNVSANNTTTPTNNDSPNNSTTDTNNQTSVELPCGSGSLVGKTCAPSGEPLVAADVKVTGTDCETGEPFELTARTDSEGAYEFDSVPAGRHTLEISTGSFNTTREIVIQKDMTTDLTSAAEKVCLDTNVEIAVIGGTYDHVEGILDSLNLDDYTVVGDDDQNSQAAIDFLKDINAMNEYDIVFINCGNLHSAALFDLQTIYDNIRMYVSGGGSLYVSDLAAPFVEGAFPDAIDFYGDDSSTSNSFKGYAPQSITADVMTPDLQAVLARDTATIDFPHDPPDVVNNNWAVAEGVGAMATAQLQGEAQLCADGNLLNPCPAAEGSVPDAPLLVTYKDSSGGTVVYTSFHNERQATLNQDMDKILRFLIFQL